MSQKPFTVGGIGAQPSLDDVVKIAQGGLVALDAAGAERIKKESPAPKSFQPEAFTAGPGPAPADAALLDAAQTRAVLATRLLTVMNGRSGVRLQVADFLTQLLNKPGLLPALPALPTDAAVLSQLADACHGAGAALQQQQPAGSGAAASPHTAAEHPHAAAAAGGPLAEALAAAGVAAPSLSAAERAVLSSGASAAAGVGALAVAGGRRLLSAATAAAALSVEALGASTKAYEAEVVEAAGYKGAMGVADELQGLLEGSKRADTFKDKSGDPGALAAFTAAPQVWECGGLQRFEQRSVAK